MLPSEPPLILRRPPDLQKANVPLEITGEHRAGFLCVVAHGNDGCELLFFELINRFGAVSRDIDCNLPHCGNGFRANPSWLRAAQRETTVALAFLSTLAWAEQNDSRTG